MTNDQAIEIAMDAVDEAVENGRPLLYRLPPLETVERMPLTGRIHLHEDKPVDVCDYEQPTHLHSIGFVKVFDDEAMTIAAEAFDLITEKYGRKASYMHEFDYEYPDGEQVIFRIKNDYEVVTIYLPCED